MKQIDSLHNLAESWNAQDNQNGFRAEVKNLFDSSHLLPELFGFTDTFFFSIDYTSKNYGYVSESVKNVLGYTKEEVIEKGFSFMTALANPQDGVQIANLMNKSIVLFNECKSNEERCSYQLKYDFRIRHKDGHEIWLLQQAFPIAFNDEGSMLCDFGMCTDITEYKTSNKCVSKIIKNSVVVYDSTAQT